MGKEEALAGDLCCQEIFLPLLKQRVSHSQKAYLIVLFTPIKTTGAKYRDDEMISFSSEWPLIMFFFLTLKAEYRRYADVEMVSGEALQAEAALSQVIVKIGGVQTAASEEIIGQGQP